MIACEIGIVKQSSATKRGRRWRRSQCVPSADDVVTRSLGSVSLLPVYRHRAGQGSDDTECTKHGTSAKTLPSGAGQKRLSLHQARIGRRPMPPARLYAKNRSGMVRSGSMDGVIQFRSMYLTPETSLPALRNREKTPSAANSRPMPMLLRVALTYWELLSSRKPMSQGMSP